MSEELFEKYLNNLPGSSNEPEAKPVTEKKPKKKREMTEERKEKLREQLKKGRETALKNRQKKALGKKIDRQDKDKELDEKIKNI